MSTTGSTFTTRRRFISILALATAGTAAAACGSAAGSPGRTSTLRYQGSVGQVTPPELAQDLGYLGGVRLKWVGNTISGPQDIQSAATGQTDFGGAFNGAVIKLQAAGAPLTSVIGYYGVDKGYHSGFFVPDDSPIRGPRDLIGKKIGMNTLGAHSEAVLDIYLQRGGLSASDIERVEPLVVPPITTEQSLRQKRIDVGVLTGIFQEKATAAGGLRKVFSDHDLLGSFTAGTYVFRDDFVKRNPETVRAFTAGVAKAIEWTRTTPRDQIVARFTKIIQARGRNENAAALKYWKSWGVAGRGGVIADREFTTWITWLEQQGQIRKGKVRPGDLYTNAFNPYAADGGRR
ncbi:ABC transporter substrate-binding protein [Actinomadura rubrisoli]|uniref:ABC transporter substrate-binding protein n=1 Tax=Actinomadura rubrisoli TaxID=2530368 RepID=A0A4R5C9G9_9ACTN|nr:ABC transporter substrate-binding protein [Actinomadura rubrisoli]TDD94840.1 ABC transporter substrate-binding protein [Actinomadura rubrisoli]